MKESYGVTLIVKERGRQIEEEGWTAEHDNAFVDGQLSKAAATYILDVLEHGGHHPLWPWESSDFKPTPNDPIRQLVKAGALIAAEIDRLQRLTSLDMGEGYRKEFDPNYGR